MTLLAFLLLACPFVCGADEIGHGDQHEASSGEAGPDHRPDQCPDGGDSCVCRGAVASQETQAALPDAGVADVLDHLTPAQPLLRAAAHHLTRDGSPTGLAGWGDALTVRAYLQNFRF